ncbi:MAG: hypothetical protein J6J36_05200 [Clostridia bacterium]|nr:hypothetical protein [Clostridia bacterium]
MDNEEKKKIQESTDPSMDEMGTWYLPGYGPGMIRKATRREYLLSGETGSWISDKEIESKEEKERKEAKAREERKKEIKESTDPSMDEIVNYSWDGHPRTDFGGVQKYSIVVTKREKLLIDLKELNPYEIWKKQEDERGEEYKK